MDPITVLVALVSFGLGAVVAWNIAGRKAIGLQASNKTLASELDSARQQAIQNATESYKKMHDLNVQHAKEKESARTEHQDEIAKLQSVINEKSAEVMAVRSELQAEHASQTTELVERYRALEVKAFELQRSASEKAYQEGMREADLRHERDKSIFSVQVRPYVLTVKSTRALVFDHYRSAVGFQYQLMVNGIPCFQPHVVIENEHEEEVINDDRLKLLANQAINVARLAVQGSNAQSFMSVIEQPILEHQAA